MIFALAITGPTASGKTALSISLAERIGAEIISCDSMQIYKGMDIGTAKATAEERARVPHHLIDFLSPTENYSVESYRADAIECAERITSMGKTPLFVGGTGLYIDSVVRPRAQDAPESDPEYRERLLSEIKSDDDVNALWERLNSVDPISARQIHKNNVKRVIRALEIFDKTGVPKSKLDEQSQDGECEVFVGMITLDFHSRETLYNRVDKRVDIMVEEGLLSEVTALYSAGLLNAGTAAQAIGYKEFVDYLKGGCTLDEALEGLKLASRRYAKRQLTWFRHEKDAKVLYVDNPDGRIKIIDELINEALILAEEFRLEYERKVL